MQEYMSSCNLFPSARLMVFRQKYDPSRLNHHHNPTRGHRIRIEARVVRVKSSGAFSGYAVANLGSYSHGPKR